ncbi:MAG TPA: bacteriohemerythrin [Thermoguttaceae bacterium]|nr:bacteriohemerythrin [Thermoguttaceae bacterium]
MDRYIVWKPFYSVGYTSLDDQHQQILEIINDLYAAMERGDDRQVVPRLLDRLFEYTKTHFAFEERILREHGYPDLESHKKLHEAMRSKTAGLRSHVGLVLGPDLLRFLKDWWLGHIQEEDQRYAPYVAAAVFR